MAAIAFRAPIDPANRVFLFFIDGDPTIAPGVPDGDAGVDSLAFRIDALNNPGLAYRKIGPNVTDWVSAAAPVGEVTAGVDHIQVQPSSITLTVNTAPTQVAVDHITVSPSSITLTPPTQVAVGTAITHFGFAHTSFGAQPGPADLQWMFGSPLFRFGWNMSGNSAQVKTFNPRCINVPYALHHFCEATGQEPTDGNTSAWATLGATWAQANGRNLEALFLHAAVGQKNNQAVITSLSATGVLSLGRQVANNKQQLTQARAGVAASNAFQPDSATTYTITGAKDASGSVVPDFTVTVSSIPSQTTLQTSYTGGALTGGTIYRPGDGTLTLGNRVFQESETDWVWMTNPGSQDGKDFQVFRVGQIMGPTDDGVFWDSHSSSNMRFQSVEYGTTSSAQYITDLCALFTLYRATYPGTRYYPNLANFTTAADDQMASAAGGCQMEGALNIFQPGRPNDSIGQACTRRLAAGVVTVLGFTPAFDSAEPHAGVTGLSSAFRASGGHNYSTPDDRSMMTCYAAALCLVDQRTPAQIAAGVLKKLYGDPAGQFFSVFPLSARWEPGFEFPLGEPTGPFIKFSPGSGAGALVRQFTDTGLTTGTPTAIVMMALENGGGIYGAPSAINVPIPVSPPAGMTWGLLKDDGTVSGAFTVGSLISLWNVDSAILVPH